MADTDQTVDTSKAGHSNAYRWWRYQVASSMTCLVEKNNGEVGFASSVFLGGFIIGDVEDVAEHGYNACLKGDVICVPGTVNLAATLSGRATPKWLLRKVSGIMGRYTLGKK